MRKNKIELIAGVVLLVVSILLLALANKVDGFAQWYSVVIYDALVSVIARIFGIFPFSVVEILLYCVITACIILIGRFIVKFIRNIINKKSNRKMIANYASGFFVAASALFLVYVTNCGVNYHRDSFSESSGIELEPYTIEELVEICQIMTEKVNQYANLVSRDDQGVMRLTEDVQSVARDTMINLATQYPELEGYYPQPKGLLVSWILSVQQVSGIYSPFTIEANVNSGMVDYNIPFTACHELSHLRGFMQEQEANFIAYLACDRSDSVEFQYSGSMLGWIYCMNELYEEKYEAWYEIRVELDPVVENDLQLNREFWAKYESKISEAADAWNDTYLKANGQEEGVKSYDRMVNLIIDYHREMV